MKQKNLEIAFVKTGLTISYYRKLKNLSQEELAEKSNLTVSFIKEIESPDIFKSFSLNELFSISKALEIPSYKLIKFE